MRKVILNKCFGGFDVSKEAYMSYAKKKGLTLYLYRPELIDGKFIYKKVNDDNLIFRYYFIKDIGDNVEISDEDYEKYCLYLKDGHREDPVLIALIVVVKIY